MNSSKNFLIYGLLCLASCSSPKKETAEVVDSTKTDSTVREEPETVYNEVGENFVFDRSVPEYLNISGKNESMIYWLSKLYTPAHYIVSPMDSLDALWVIRSVELVDEDFSNAEGKCINHPVLLVQRYIRATAEEYYDVHFITKNGSEISSEKVTYSGDIAQSTASASLSTDYKLSDKCPVLAVTSDSDGGDIETVKTKEISFFIPTETGMKMVLNLVLEETKTEYQASPQDEEKSTSELRDFEILSKKTKGLYDIKVHLISKKDGEVIEEKDTVFRFNGEKYSE